MAEVQPKRKKAMPEESNHNLVIPPELVFEILTRLPVKSLCRFKCVSTLWCSIISDRGFTSSHWLHRRSRPTLLVALPHCGKFVTQKFISKDRWLQLHAHGAGANTSSSKPHGISSLSSVLKDLGAAPHFKFHLGERAEPMVMRSVGGLVCLDFRDRIMICNPSTGQHVMYPSVRAQAQHPKDYGAQWTSLCFDPVTNQHKVLQSIGNVRLRVLENYVMIFSKDRSWRRIGDTPGFGIRLDGDGVCLNGVLYYRLLFKGPGRYLMKFHVHEERFELFSGDLERRQRCISDEHQSKLVEFFNGRLAIVDFPWCKHNGRIIHLWLLDHEGITLPMQPQTVILPPEEILPRPSQLSLLGSIHAGKVLVFMSTTVKSSSESFCLFYDAKNNIFTKGDQIRTPILGGNPAYRPMIHLLSVSDHEENLMVLEN